MFMVGWYTCIYVTRRYYRTYSAAFTALLSLYEVDWHYKYAMLSQSRTTRS